MSRDINVITLLGRMTGTPTLKRSDNDTDYCYFNVANNYQIGDTEGVNFFGITVFGKLAVVCQQYLKKGQQVAISGTLRQSVYEDKEGKTVRKTKIIANQVQFLALPKNQNNDESTDTEEDIYPDDDGMQEDDTANAREETTQSENQPAASTANRAPLGFEQPPCSKEQFEQQTY